MNLGTHFEMLARYNRIANERLFAKCGQLDDAEYRKKRAGSFGSIHGLLNHLLLGDRRWMELFESGERVTPPLNQILYDDFSSLQRARAREDARIEAFFAGLDAAFWSRRSLTRIIRAKTTWRRRTWHAVICSITRRTIEGRST